jgi:hypothetical protein
MKGVLPWLVGCACHAGTRDFCSALVDPVKNIFFPYYYYSFVSSPASWAGSCAGSTVSFYVPLSFIGRAGILYFLLFVTNAAKAFLIEPMQ